MKQVLVPYDFSPYSRRALELALLGYPFGSGAAVKVLHVVDEHLYESVLSKGHVPDEEAILSYLNSDIAKVKEELSAKPSALPELAVRVERGSPSKHILDDAERLKPAGVILGGQGHGGAKERVLGRTAQRVVRGVNCPVHVVKDPLSRIVPRRVLCAVDFSEHSQKALQTAARAADGAAAKLSLIHVRENPYIPYLRKVASEIHDKEALEGMIAERRSKLLKFEADVLGGKKADTHHVVFGATVETIINQSEILQAGTIVVGSHGYGAVATAFIGSIAEGLINRSLIDVLVVR